MSDLTLSLKIDLSKFNGSLEQAKKALLGVEGTHIVKVDADPKNALDGLSKIGNALTGLWASMQMVKSAWNNTVGSWVANAQDSVRAYKLVEQGIIATGGAAGYTAKELSGIDEELMKITDYDDDEIMEKLTSPLLTFRNIAGPTFKEAQERALDLSTVLHQDLQSSAIQLGKALNDPIQGVTALRRVGIQLTEQQEAQVKSFMAVNDIASAQRIILDELANQVGGQAKATADPIKQMAVAFGNVGEALGKVLLPYINQFARYMVDVVVPFIQNDFIPAVKGVVEFFGKWGAMIVSVVIPALSAYFIQAGLSALATLSISGAFVTLGKTLSAFIATNPFLLISAAVGFLAYEIYKAYQKTDSFKGVLLAMGAGLTVFAKAIYNFGSAIVKTFLWITEAGFNPFKQVLSSLITSVKYLLQGDFENAGKAISSGLIDNVIAGQKRLFSEMTENWKKIANDSAYQDIAKYFFQPVAGAWGKAEDKTKESTDKIINDTKKALDSINSLGGANASSTSGTSSTSSNQKTNNRTNFGIAKPELEVNEQPDNNDEVARIMRANDEKLQAYADFYDKQDYIEMSSYDLQAKHINDEVELHREAWLAMGITEEEIERQQSARLLEASQEFQGFTRTIESGYDTLVDGITDKSLNMKERWDKVWQSMGKTAIKALADILKQQAVNLTKTIFFHRAETASHTAKETTKTAVTSANSSFRIGILIVESVKEIGLAVATSIKFVATQLYKVAGSLMAYFTSVFGPFGIPMALVATAGAVGFVNQLRKGFKVGGWTGSGSDDEEAGVVHKNEIVFESAIAKKYKSAIMNFRSALQSGVNPMNFAGPQLSFAGGGNTNNADMGGYFKSLENKLDILNKNLVEKDTSVNIQNKIDGKSIVRSMDKQKATMKSRGYNDRSAN